MTIPVQSIQQKPQTPKSEAKKVTFGLKNNKTAGKTTGPDGGFRTH